MPESASNQKVKLLSGDTMTLQNRDGPKLRRQASVIKATQNQDEKKMIFQVGITKLVIWQKKSAK